MKGNEFVYISGMLTVSVLVCVCACVCMCVGPLRIRTSSCQYPDALGLRKSGKAVSPGHTLPMKMFPFLSFKNTPSATPLSHAGYPVSCLMPGSTMTTAQDKKQIKKQGNAVKEKITYRKTPTYIIHYELLVAVYLMLYINVTVHLKCSNSSINLCDTESLISSLYCGLLKCQSTLLQTHTLSL